MTTLLVFTFGIVSGYFIKTIQNNSEKIMRLYRAISEVDSEEPTEPKEEPKDVNNFKSREFPIQSFKTFLRKSSRNWYKTILTIIKLNYENLYTRFIQTVKTPHLISHDTYEIEYFYKGKIYRLQLKDNSQSLSSKSFNVYNEHGEEITSRLLEYLGPQLDFHSRGLTPKDLGYKRITILDENFNEYTYNENESITVGQSL